MMVLGLGLKFIPRALTSTHLLSRQIDEALVKLKRRLEVALFFDTDYCPDPFIPYNKHKTAWEPDWPLEKDHLRVQIKHVIGESRKDALQALSSLRQCYTPEDRRLREILSELAKDDSIVIMDADKNLGVVLMDSDDYHGMCRKHLDDASTYERTDYRPEELYEALRSILGKHKQLVDDKGAPTPLAKSLLQIPVEKLHAAHFYCLPKLHKKIGIGSAIPGRPIASTIGTHSEAASKYLDKKLRQVMKHISDTVCDSSIDLVLDLEAINDKNWKRQMASLNTDDYVLFCADVASLYPSIPTGWGLERVRLVCEQYSVFPPDELEFLLELLKWVLETNIVEFKGEFWRQKQGTAMGTPVAVVYAVIVMCWMEQSTGLPKLMLYYKRYIDDVFAICTRRQKEAFVAAFNGIKSQIQFDDDSITPKLTDPETGREGVMLDLSIWIESFTGTVEFSLYQKPLNNHQHIPPLSGHQQHVFPAILLNEFKRASLRCSDSDAFYEQVGRFYKQFADRGYPLDMLHKALCLVPSRHELLCRAAAGRRNREKERTQGWINRLKRTRPILTSSLPSLMCPDGSRFRLAQLVQARVSETDLENTREWRRKFVPGPLIDAHKNQAKIRAILSKR